MLRGRAELKSSAGAARVTPDGGPVQMRYMPSDDNNGAILSARLGAYGMAIGTVLGHDLPSAHILGLEHVLSFPDPKKSRQVAVNTLKYPVSVAARLDPALSRQHILAANRRRQTISRGAAT